MYISSQHKDKTHGEDIQPSIYARLFSHLSLPKYMPLMLYYDYMQTPTTTHRHDKRHIRNCQNHAFGRYPLLYPSNRRCICCVIFLPSCYLTPSMLPKQSTLEQQAHNNAGAYDGNSSSLRRLLLGRPRVSRRRSRSLSHKSFFVVYYNVPLLPLPNLPAISTGHHTAYARR
jgi:hypothetical protein